MNDAFELVDIAPTPPFPRGEGKAGGATVDWGWLDRCATVFRGLRSQLSERAIIVVASPRRGDGRSSLAAGLSMAIAHETDDATLLLDLDFEHPDQAKRFDVPSTPGLVHHLEGGAPLRAIRNRGRGPVWVLPAGARRAAGRVNLYHALASGNLLAACRERFSWTVVDLPPLLEYPETRLVSDLADGYVVVGRHRQTTFRALRQTARALVASRPAGLVMIG